MSESLPRTPRTTTAHRWFIRRIRINRAGYDRAGRYWGTEAPLWYVHRDDDEFDFFIRGTREYAKCAADWAEHTDTAAACARITATGKMGKIN